MPKTKAPASVWMAEQFLLTHRLVAYQEDIYAYSPGNGLYERAERAWLGHAVTRFLAETLGSDAVGSDYVADVGRSVRDLAFLPGVRQPPFWTDRPDPADVIVAANGVVDLGPLLAGGVPQLRPHTPDLLAVAGVPYAYDPAAACPAWLDTLRWAFGDRDPDGTVRLVQQFCGWAFVSHLLRLEAALWLTGPGGNGKSTILKVIRHVIGESATSAVGLESFTGGGDSFRLWPTIHKRANFTTDAAVKRKANVAGLNAFISGDPMTIDRKFRDRVTVEPTVACFFASNQPPLFDDATDAWWRRLLLVRCDRRPDEAVVNPGLVNDLKAEAPGILNWMLAAIPDLLRRQRFEVPAAVRDNVAHLKLQVKSARMFLAEKVEAGDAGRDFIARDQLMALFEGWCRDNGYRADDLSVVKEEVQRAFGVDLDRLRRGVNPGGGRERVRGWPGVRWRADEDLLPPRPLDELFRGERDQHQKAQKQSEEEAIKRGQLIRRQGELITIMEGQIARLKKQAADAGPADAGTVPAVSPAATPARIAAAEPDGTRAAAELDALMALLPDPDDEAPAGRGA